MKNAIIFDMDGVLILSEHMHVQAEQRACRDFGIMAPEEAWDDFQGRTARDIFHFLNVTYGDSKHDVQQLISRKTQHFVANVNDIHPLPGIYDFLRFCRTRFTKIALVTSSNRETQRAIFAAHHFAPYFDSITTGDEVTHGKPDPEPYNIAQKKIAIPAARCIVVEDSRSGIASAKAAGMRVLAIASSLTTEQLAATNADWIAKDYTIAQEILTAL